MRTRIKRFRRRCERGANTIEYLALVGGALILGVFAKDEVMELGKSLAGKF